MLHPPGIRRTARSLHPGYPCTFIYVYRLQKSNRQVAREKMGRDYLDYMCFHYIRRWLCSGFRHHFALYRSSSFYRC